MDERLGDDHGARGDWQAEEENQLDRRTGDLPERLQFPERRRQVEEPRRGEDHGTNMRVPNSFVGSPYHPSTLLGVMNPSISELIQR